MECSISTHLGGDTFSYAHNTRNDKYLKNLRALGDTHIGDESLDEVWLNRGDVKQVYSQLFGEAVIDYNNKQIAKGRPDRVLQEDYYEYIKNSKNGKHLTYELIIGVYDKNGSEIPEEMKRKIYMEYVKGFMERNPNMYLFSVCYHNSEENSHCHLAMVPIYTSERFLECQTGLKKALQCQGFIGTGAKNSEQIQWERNENLELENICKRYNITVLKSKEKKEHLQTDIFKLTKEREKVAEEYEQTIENNRILVKKYNELVNAFNKLVEAFKELQRRKNKMIESELERRHSRYKDKSR